MAKLDPFTQRRIARFIEDFRKRSGQLPTLGDFEKNGMDRNLVDQALKDSIIEKFYVTLTTGTIMKGFKVKDPFEES